MSQISDRPADPPEWEASRGLRRKRPLGEVGAADPVLGPNLESGGSELFDQAFLKRHSKRVGGVGQEAQKQGSSLGMPERPVVNPDVAGFGDQGGRGLNVGRLGLGLMVLIAGLTRQTRTCCQLRRR